MKDGQQIQNANIKLKDGYPTRSVKVQLKWVDGRPPGEVTVTGQADKGDNPAAHKIGESLYEFTLLQSARYTFSAWEDLDPQRLSQRHGDTTCTVPARIESDTRNIDAADAPSDNATGNSGGAPSVITLTFNSPPCN